MRFLIFLIVLGISWELTAWREETLRRVVATVERLRERAASRADESKP